MEDMVAEFITETVEGLAVIDQELVKLEKDPQNKTILGNIFRVMHTIKGACGFLALNRLEKVAHAGENILGKFRDGEIQVTPHAITLILQSTDRIRFIIEHISENAGKEPSGDDNDLISSLDSFIEGKEPASQNQETSEDLTCFFKGDDELQAMIDEIENAKILKEESKKEAASAAHQPAKSEEKTSESRELAQANQTIRVNIDVLEKMMQMVGELVLARNQLMQIARTDENQKFLSPLQQLSHITTELQESVMKTRMQPIGSAWQKFPRLVRDLSLELGKKIELKMIGEDTELDRQLLEAVKDPLTHMVRNSCDHGIETPEKRRNNGKSETGTVTLNAYHDGGHIVIDISDDGNGISVDRVKEKVLANGLATQAELAALSERQILQFIFAPGFSTAEKVTAVSGRGVGMDVVKTNVEKIGGTIDLFSTPGKGSRVSIKIPLTLAIVSVLIVEKIGQQFAIPQINVRELIQVGNRFPIKLENIDNAKVIRLRGSLLPVVSLADILKLSPEKESSTQTEGFVVVCSVGGTDFGVMVDRIHNIEEIVVKPVSKVVKSVPLFAGNTILGDGNVIMILDPNNLAKEVGEIKLNKEQNTERKELVTEAEDKLINFLLFRHGKGAAKAVPLELVWRLEEIDVSKIEYPNGQPVVQYRDDLMRILSLDGHIARPEKGIMPVIVFLYDDKIYGLPVDRITDIVESPFSLQLPSQSQSYIGSMVIQGKTTDIVDVAQILGHSTGSHADAHIITPSNDDTVTASVLLIDDSPFFLKMTAPVFVSAGFRTITAESGNEALAKLEQATEDFDLIVTDINMPGMSGFGFAEAFKTSSRNRDIPIIGCTATMSADTLSKSKAAGMITCVPKNNRPELLRIMTETWTNIGA